MSFKIKLLNLLNRKDYIPLPFEDLAKKLHIKEIEKQELKSLLNSLLEEGTIALIKKNRFVIAKDADLLSGIIKFKASGAALFFPDTGINEPQSPPIDINSEDTDVAFHGDHILARIFKKRPRPRYNKGRRLPPIDEPVHARVKRILKRARTTITGTLQKSNNFFYVTPDDPRFVHDITVPSPETTTLDPRPKVGDKVIVKLHDWTQPHLSPEGVLIETLGATHSPHAEFNAILHKYNLNPEFPEEIEDEANKIPQKVPPAAIKHRLDCREIFTFTIDPDDAKDFDDALSVEELPNQETQVGIHVADVGAYVKPNTHLDNDAKTRGNSTYLVGQVIPMLPQSLSNGICSLVEDEDRLTKAVFVTFDKNGHIKNVKFANSVIRSNKRLTYKQAHALLFKDDLDEIRKTPLPPAHQTGSIGRALKNLSNKELDKLQKSIRLLWKFASKIRNDRMREGSLDFDIPDVKIYVDKNGHADRIETIIYDESHQLIEEYMLLANEEVARACFSAKFPIISRVHDNPDTDKLNELRDTLSLFNIETGDLTNRKNVTRLLKKISTHPQGYSLKIHFLRSLKQACYRARADGHYGLNKKYYSHFTSPIRRYSDLITHRVFDALLVHQRGKTAARAPIKMYKQAELDSLAQHISITEQNSTEAERESVKIKLLEYFELQLKKSAHTTFSAIISEIRNYGFFVELTESMAYGLVPLSSITDDMYHLNDASTLLKGRRHGRTFTIGQQIQVTVERVDRFKRQIDFRLATTDREPKNLQQKLSNLTRPRKSKNKSRRSEDRNSRRK